MIRVLFPLLLVFVALMFVIQALGRFSRPDNPQHFRPRKPRGTGARGPGAATDSEGFGHSFVMNRSELAGLRDALTGGPLDADDELSRCADCNSFYGMKSLQALVSENGARCVSCGSLHRLAVVLRD